MDIEKERLDYACKLYETLLRWYDNADGKAKVLLTLDGALVSFLTSSVFAKKADLTTIVSFFDLSVWAALSFMSVSMVLSILAAVGCLWSRVWLSRTVREHIERSNASEERSSTYSPDLILFFGFIRKLRAVRYIGTLAQLSPSDELEALAWQIHALSENVFRKHWLVNVGFVFFGISLIAFLVAGALYVTKVTAALAASSVFATTLPPDTFRPDHRVDGQGGAHPDQESSHG